MNKRKYTFDEYRKSTQLLTLNKIRTSLKILKNAKFKNITSLAKSVASIINETESLKQDTNNITRPLSYITLLRNNEYNKLLLIKLNGEQVQSLSTSVSEYELLKIHCANLEVQNESLKRKIISIDADSISLANYNSLDSEAILQQAIDIKLLIYIINQIMYEVKEIFLYKEDGLYSPMGNKIIDSLQINRYNELNNNS